MPYLQHRGPDGSTIEFWNLHEGPTTVGRGDESNAKVDDMKLSRKHFTITHEAAGFTLKDLGSTNGTAVNGHRVSEQVLKPNDVIRAGASTFVMSEGLTTMSMKLDEDIKNLAKCAPDSAAPSPK
jgi:pSer/pThr/pTyr-binding forkhead associated (FHA) protein